MGVSTADCIFQQKWWWDAVCESSDIREYGLEDGSLWRLCKMKWLRLFPVLSMPVLTQHSGPYLVDRNRFLQIFHQIPSRMPLHFNLGFELFPEEIELLEKEGYTVYNGVSHRIEDCSDIGGVWSHVKDSQRRQIKKARQRLHKVDDCPLNVLVEMQKETFQRRGMRLPYPEHIVYRLYKAVIEHDAGQMVALADESGQIQASGLFVYDSQTCYSLTHGFHKTAVNLGAGSLLQWEGIEIASKKGLIFDFEGSNVDSIARFNLSFGATPKKYHGIERIPYFLKSAIAFRDALRSRLGAP